jgi:predicted O-methyltransferase YrrM
MSRTRLVIAAAVVVMFAVVVLVGRASQASGADVLTGLLVVAGIGLTADARWAQRRQAQLLRLATEAAERRNREALGHDRRLEEQTRSGLAETRALVAALRQEVAGQAEAARTGADEAAAAAARARYWERITDWHQTEAMLNLHAMLPPRQALPPTRSWGASPDLLLLVVSHVLAHRPRTVLECGSGASTLWLAYAVERLGAGRVVSLENDDRYAERTTTMLERHGLTDWVEVRTAPLTEVHLAGSAWRWYDLAALDGVAEVDLLLVDGPPGPSAPLARYPALPLLHDRLAADATVLLDDAVRADERTIAQRWASELNFDVEHLSNLEKGLLVLRRSAT